MEDDNDKLMMRITVQTTGHHIYLIVQKYVSRDQRGRKIHNTRGSVYMLAQRTSNQDL